MSSSSSSSTFFLNGLKAFWIAEAMFSTLRSPVICETWFTTVCWSINVCLARAALNSFSSDIALRTSTSSSPQMSATS